MLDVRKCKMDARMAKVTPQSSGSVRGKGRGDEGDRKASPSESGPESMAEKTGLARHRTEEDTWSKMVVLSWLGPECDDDDGALRSAQTVEGDVVGEEGGENDDGLELAAPPWLLLLLLLLLKKVTAPSPGLAPGPGRVPGKHRRRSPLGSMTWWVVAICFCSNLATKSVLFWLDMQVERFRPGRGYQLFDASEQSHL